MSKIKIKINDDVDIQLTFTDEDGNAIDLTSGTVKFVLKNNKSDTDGQAIYINENCTLTTPASGIATCSIPDTTTKNFTAGECYWQARFIDSGGAIKSSEIGGAIIEENLFDAEV